MTGTQLDTLIKTIAPESQEELGKWLTWRLGDKEGYLLLMYQQLLIKPDWQSVWKLMFPHKDFPAGPEGQIPHIVRKRASRLKKLIEEYIGCLALREDHYTQDLYLLRHFNFASARDAFTIQLKRMERSYQREDGSFHEQMGVALEEHFFHESSRAGRKKNHRWNEMVKHFAIGYRHRFLELYMARLNNKGLPAEDKKPNDFSLQDLLVDPLVNESPSLKVMLQLCLVLEDQGDHHELILLFKQNHERFESYMQQNIFICLENRLSAKAIDNPVDLKARFDFFLWGDEAGLLAYEGGIQYNRFNGFVNAGIDIGEIETVQKLMEKYKSALPPKLREDVYQFANGLCLLAENRIEELISGFRNHKFPNVTIDTNASLLHLQARYERGDRASLEDPLRALKIKVNRNERLNAGFQLQIKLKVDLFLKLIRSYKRPKLQKLLTQASIIKSHHFRKWIVNMIQERLDNGESLY